MTAAPVGDASREDLPQILGIYNEVIRNSTAVYSEEEFTAARGESWFAAKAEQGHPMIVARDASGVAGFGTFGEFRAGPVTGRRWSTACMCVRTGAVRVSEGRWWPSSWRGPPPCTNTS